jgi:hypothetical protein
MVMLCQGLATAPAHRAQRSPRDSSAAAGVASQAGLAPLVPPGGGNWHTDAICSSTLDSLLVHGCLLRAGWLALAMLLWLGSALAQEPPGSGLWNAERIGDAAVP